LIPYTDQGRFQTNRDISNVSLISNGRTRIARTLLTGEFFLADTAKARGATASSSPLVFAAIAALGASVYRLWTSAELTNRRHALARALSRRVSDELQIIKASYGRQAERVPLLSALPISTNGYNSGLHARPGAARLIRHI
jgi:hypothetical protein